MPPQLRIKTGRSSILPDQTFTVIYINYQWKPKRARIRSSEVSSVFRPTGKIPLSKVAKNRLNSEASSKAVPVEEDLPVSNSFASLQDREMECKSQANSAIILNDELKDDPNGMDCIRMESNDLAWSLSEHQRLPTTLLAPGMDPNSGAASIDNFPNDIDGRDSPLEDQEFLPQIVDDVLMGGNAQIKMKKPPVSYAEIIKHGTSNATEVMGSNEPLLPTRPITEEDHLAAIE
ncbi:hypothetical protein Nepgr_014801 [Nepenthes gracilis]|uniref:Uncharacterized protein n=1 Tax=Nepenthes gracilis TaxID=150966 RepID=A0AAD3XQU7_NEPGR|nr:hypothetical protein Nepgr_014801 [Nepenthes gracilis]